MAEDNLINQKLTVRILEKLGYQSDVVENGQEALAALDRGSYALVLMDCQMPVVDGFEATKLLRQREAAAQESAASGSATTCHIPIVALTANAMRGDRERCLAAGMDDYLTKPVRKEDLKGVLNRWIPSSVASTDCNPAKQNAVRRKQTLTRFPIIFDVAATLRNIGGDRALLEDLIELFLQRYEAMLEQIRVALADERSSSRRASSACAERDRQQSLCTGGRVVRRTIRSAWATR